ncbi:MAG: choice-of-anchor Q domain-containing protein [Paludibacter sp.]
MKKITFIVALLCSISAFSTRYLVQNNGTTLWNGNATGTIVTLGSGQTLNTWYSANSATFVAGTDEIWLATGTYVTDGTLTLKNGVNLYGGFAGTEATAADRAKGTNVWSFTYPTTIDGNNANRKGIVTGTGTTTTYIDGITVTKFNITGAAANVTGVGVQINANWIMQNCIVTANTFTNSGAIQCRGAGVYVKGGQLLNSNIINNSATKGTGTGSTYGGGVAFSYNASPVTTVKGCTLESNTSTVTGGGMAILDGTGGTIEDCIFKFNNSAAGSGGGIGTSSAASANGTLSIKNCQFIENTAATGNGGGVSLDLSITSPASTTFDGCLFSGNTALTQGGGLNANTGIYAAIKNCIFRDNKNTTTANGSNATSALYYGAATGTTVSNCVFVNNSTTTNTSGNNTIKFYNDNNNLYNCTIANNANPGGYALAFNGKIGNMTNCLFWGNTGAGLLQGIATNVATTYNATDNFDIFGKTYSNNIKTLTVSPNNTFTNPTGFAGVSTDATTKSAVAAADWSLKLGCPAINAGTDLSASPILLTTDILLTTRPQGSAYDMGAYELPYYNTTITFNAGGAVNSYATGAVDQQPKGTQLAFIITPSSGKGIQSILYNGTEVKSQLTNLLGSSVYYGGTYTAPAITGTSTLVVTFEIDPTTKLDEIHNDFKCFTNKRAIEISGLTKQENVMVYNIAGALVYNQFSTNSAVSIPVQKGVYLVRISDQVNKVIVK